MKIKVCSVCNKRKNISEFSLKNSKTGTRMSKCKICQRAYSKIHYRQNKQKYLERNKQNRELIADRIERNREFIYLYLLKHPCVDCGEENPVILTFDHIRGVKKYNVSNLVSQGYSLNTIKTEIAKCEIRCFNCHMKKNNKDFGYHRSKFTEKLVEGLEPTA